MKRFAVTLLIAFALVLLFAYTAISKLTDYESFRTQLGHSGAGRLFAPVAWLVPLSELVIVGMLIVKRWRRAGLVAACIFLVVATIYIAVGMGAAIDLECACGGFLDAMPKPAHILFNLFFAGGAVAAIQMEKANIRTKDIS